MIPGQDFQLGFLRKLQRIFNDGQFVATYKFALLHALATLCCEREPEEDGTLALTPKDLAGKFLELYWEQARPFNGDAILLAATGRQAELITRLLKVRPHYRTFAQFRQGAHYPAELARAAGLIVKMPLWKLQTA